MLLEAKDLSDSRYQFDKYVYSILIEDEASDDDVHQIPIDSRRCKFPEESEGLWTFRHYSYEACISQCRMQRKIELCNCTDKQVGYATGNFNVRFII